MAVKRDLAAEQRAVSQFKSANGNKLPNLNDPKERASIYRLAYPPQGGLPDELKNTVDESLYAAGTATGQNAPLAQTVAGSNLGQLQTNVATAQAGVEKMSQPNEALRILQEAIRTKSGMAEQPLGPSKVFEQAGLTGMGSLNASLKETNDKFTNDFSNFSNTIGQMSGTYKDMASMALNKYNAAYTKFKDESDRLQKIQDDINQHKDALETMNLQYQNSLKLEEYKRNHPDVDTQLNLNNAGKMLDDKGNISDKPFQSNSFLGNVTVTAYNGSDLWKPGLDVVVAGGKGAPVVYPFTDTGTVIKVGKNGEFGNQVQVKTSSGDEIWLSHLGGTNVKVGDKVTQGTKLGSQGNTGTTYSTSGGDGTHLDITMKNKNGQYYTAPEVSGMMGINKSGSGAKNLTAEDKLKIKSLSVDLFGVKSGTAAENVKTIEDLYSQGKSIDEIRDIIKYSQQSTGLSGSYRDAASAASMSMPAEKRQNFLDEVDRNLAAGNTKQAINNIKNASIDALGVDESKIVRGKERTVQFLNEVQNDLAAYEAKGGKTNIFTGTAENIMAKAGATKDAELRKIATKIATSIQNYRRSMTGVAFSAPENAEYKKMFPTISKTGEFNKAVIDGLKETFVGDLEYFYKKQLGEKPYEELIKPELLNQMNQTSGSGKAISTGTASTGNKFTITKE